ncbi:MAG: phosphate/phosphite/phosphonate ABC transporter substrate-binding protein [Verrucomicrobiota bacterium]
MSWRVAALISFLAVCLAGCMTESVEIDESSGWPKKVRFAFTPDEEEPGRREKVYVSVMDYLSEQVGVEMELVKTTQYGPVIEAMRARKIEMSNFSTFPYLIASKKAGAEAIIGRSNQDGSRRQSQSYIVVRGDSDIDTIDELIERKEEIRFAFVNPASTSGHLIPRYYLEQRGINPEQDFKELVFPGKQNASILAIASGKVDAGAISKGVLIKLLRVGSLEKGDLKVIWELPEYPSGAISVRSDLPVDLKMAIQKAYLDLPDLDPDLNQSIKELSSQYLTNPQGDYIAVNDASFDGIRALSGRIEGLKMLE